MQRKKGLFKTMMLLGLMSASVIANADIATGKVVSVQTSPQGDYVYFKLDPMPAAVTQWFVAENYSDLRSSPCVRKGSQASVYLTASTVMALKVNNGDAEVNYCVTPDGYGIVTWTDGYVRMN